WGAVTWLGKVRDRRCGGVLPSGPDWKIVLTELLRVIQFFNSGGCHYCPGDATEDGFCPGMA
ncbi:MAG TPA: hypothetical protein PKI11_17905, partial [Candidatus Hydrogenedentes bacterium]|nr:hypothetical protein [Candidatus Hydrogenedentota bacterium]